MDEWVSLGNAYSMNDPIAADWNHFGMFPLETQSNQHRVWCDLGSTLTIKSFRLGNLPHQKGDILAFLSLFGDYEVPR